MFGILKNINEKEIDYMRSFVGADIGASGTRVTSETGAITDFPNNMVFVDNADKVDIEPRVTGEDATKDFQMALDLTVYKVSGARCEFFPARALIGNIAERYSPTNERPSVARNKSVQRVNYMSMILSVAYERAIHGIDRDVDLYLALPPMEASAQKEVVANNLIGTYEVVMNKMEGKRIGFNIRSVICVEEALMSLLSFFFEVSGKPTQYAKDYATGHVLSLDIGASTTDLAVAKNLQYLEKSGQTYKTGGNVIQAYMSNVIRNRFGYDPTIEELDYVVSTGLLPSGNKHVNMAAELANAKKEFARSIVEQIQSYFRLVNIPLQTVRAIVVSGGGSLASGYIGEDGKFNETCAPASEFITKELNNIVDGIDVIAMPDDARHANIKGIFIKASMDRMKQKKAEAQMRQQITPEQAAQAPTQGMADPAGQTGVGAGAGAQPQVYPQTAPITDAVTPVSEALNAIYTSTSNVSI